MRDKLEKIVEAYAELEQKLADPAVVSDPKEYARVAKEHSNQADLVAHANKYITALDDIEAAKELLNATSDPEEKEMLQEDIAANEEMLPQLEDEIKVMLIPGDPNDEKDTIVEIRAGVGGDEAAIFAGDLFKMYERFAEARGWKTEILSSSPSEAGGFKTIEFKVTGDKVYSVMKYESGVHRVQRVPKTESQGRIQTSTATVAVLPEADEIDIQINQEDLRIDTYCVLLTSQHIPLFSLRISVLRFRTARSACRCFVLASMRWSWSVSRLSRVQSVFPRLAMAHVPRRSVRTTSHRTV